VGEREKRVIAVSWWLLERQLLLFVIANRCLRDAIPVPEIATPIGIHGARNDKL
jgi:hypothetical protein